MEIEQSFRVGFAADAVWRCFRDIETIVGCLPGAALTAPPGDGKLPLSMTVKLGPIVANFAGQGEMTLDDAARRGRILGAGGDRKSGSRIKGEASFSLHDDGAHPVSTRVDIRVDYAIAGSLAQFSRGGLVRELAERITLQFSDNLRRRLAADHAAPPPAVASPTRTGAPLDLGRMFWPMLLARLKRWLRRPARRLDDAAPRDD